MPYQTVFLLFIWRYNIYSPRFYLCGQVIAAEGNANSCPRSKSRHCGFGMRHGIHHSISKPLRHAGLQPNEWYGAMWLFHNRRAFAFLVFQAIYCFTVTLFIGTAVFAPCIHISSESQNRSLVIMEPKSMEEIVQNNPYVTLGGRYIPLRCKAPERVALVVPYRLFKT